MLLLSLALAVPGCATAPEEAASAVAPVARPVAGGERGGAAFYHRRHNGRRMANGEPFRPDSDSAAHRTLPFGTRVRVTNLANGRATTVVIRDRGPFTRGRVIDLSPRSAREIGFTDGVAQVELRPLSR
jgi:rare lipoprotein A